MCRRGTVHSHYGPVVVQPAHLIGSKGDHGLYGQGHSGLQPDSFSPLSEVGDLWIFVKTGSDPVAYQVSDHAIAKFGAVSVNGIGNVMKMRPSPGMLYSFKKALPCNLNQLFCFLAYLPYGIGSCRIRVIAFIDQSCIQAYNIAFHQNSFFGRNSMDHLIIDRNTNRCRVPIIIEEIRHTSIAAYQLFPHGIDIPCGNSGLYHFSKLCVNLCKDLAGFTHEFNFMLGFNCDSHLKPCLPA